MGVYEPLNLHRDLKRKLEALFPKGTWNEIMSEVIQTLTILKELKAIPTETYPEVLGRLTHPTAPDSREAVLKVDEDFTRTRQVI